MAYASIGAALVSAGAALASPPPAQLEAAKEVLAAQYVSDHVSCPGGTAIASWHYRDSIEITISRLIEVKQEGSSQSATVDCSGDQYTLNGTQLTVPELAAYAAATVDRIRAENARPGRKSGGGMPVVDGSILHRLEAETQSLNTQPARSANQDGNEQR